MATIAKRGWRVVLAAALLGGIGAGLATAQKYTPPPPKLTTEPCKPTKKEPCPTPESQAAPAAEKFPFPGEGGTAAPESPAQAGKPAQNGAKPAAPDAFPFPDGKTPDMPGAASGAAPASTPAEGAGTSSSSSSASSGSSSSSGSPLGEAEAPAKPGAGPRGRHVLPKVEDKDRREAEDLEVSRYYTSTGNHLGAYNRAVDAVATFPDDPEAHYLLAQTAERLGHKDEAVAEYARTIQMEPDGEHAAAARKALTTLVKR